jgi:hypothetical protein
MTSAEVVDLLWQNPLQPGEELARFDPCSLHAGTWNCQWVFGAPEGYAALPAAAK